MIILDKVSPLQYFIFFIDFIVIFIFFYIAVRNIQTMRVLGVFKALLSIIVFWFIARVAGLEMSENVLRTVISYSLLALIVMFPNEFKKTLDNFGRKDIVQWNKYKIIDKESIKELSEAMMELSRRREGALIVISRKSDLLDVVEKGDGEDLGNLKIKRHLIQELLKEGSYYSEGALIIRDNEIVSANTMLDMTNHPDLVRRGAGRRHLAAFWVASERDSIALVVSGKTGRITIASTENKEVNYMYSQSTRETDLMNGLDEVGLSRYIDSRITGKNIVVDKESQDKKGKKDSKSDKKGKKDKKSDKKSKVKGNKKDKKNKEEEKENKSKGFGN